MFLHKIQNVVPFLRRRRSATEPRADKVKASSSKTDPRVAEMERMAAEMHALQRQQEQQHDTNMQMLRALMATGLPFINAPMASATVTGSSSSSTTMPLNFNLVFNDPSGRAGAPVQVLTPMETSFTTDESGGYSIRAVLRSNGPNPISVNMEETFRRHV
ncbi:hypothetical protein MSAN_01319400 [Mycena sanguinolenta]|uniref:Uncharacterized protein n=1 Tax=Mycena sanguinolenta TaxID=230812 RepID=A0A8H6YFC3_9AGAR|nr:hypothetical protein MSAN_01319400 [Mycena sanguinolenta]